RVVAGGAVEGERRDVAERALHRAAVDGVAAAVRSGRGEDDGVVAGRAVDHDADRGVGPGLEAGRTRLGVRAGGQERRELHLVVGVDDLVARTAGVVGRGRAGGRAPPVVRGVERAGVTRPRGVSDLQAGGSVAGDVILVDRDVAV